MTYNVTLSSKGQLTLPVDIRRALNLNAGDQITVEQHGKTMRLLPKPKTGRFAKYRGTMDFKIPGGRKGIIKYVHDMRDGI